MSHRSLQNWLTSYMQWVDNTESATIFHKWVALSIVAGALMKKTNLALGRLRVYPNMYIVLVAEPGIARKTQAIDWGQKIMTGVPEIMSTADASTKEALLSALEESMTPTTMRDGSQFMHNSVTIVSREFETFLGQKKENTKMVVLLTDLFDCKELPWRYKTKHSGSNEIHSVYLNLQAATTPESIASCLPSSAIGGGLTSRVLWIWADRRSKKCSRPEENAEMKVLESKLINDLAVIARIQGTYQFTDDSGNRWDAWYNNYEELDVKRICKDPSFNGWYSRKPTYILKVAQLLAAVESDSLVMEWRFIQEAIKLVEETEENMGGVFRAVGKSVISSEVDMVMQLIKKNQAISEEKLMSIIWKDADAAKFDAIIQTCLRTGQIKRDFHDPEGNMHKEIWYYETNYFKSVARKWVKPEALKLADREDGNVKSVEGSA